MTCIALDTDTLPLLTLAESVARVRLADSAFAALLPHEKVADLFCGAGGWGEGARELGIRVDFAVNHWDTAIDIHRENNPDCKHHLGDAWRARPRDVIGEGTTLGLLLASAACTTHSRARGSAPISKRVHMLGWCIARWMEEVAPRIVLIENVPEWQDWGPTILRDGLRVQDPARKGQHFRRWWRYCERLGYRMEMRVLDAPDFGAASRRKRLFIQARRDGLPLVWPEKTHGRTTKPERGPEGHGDSVGQGDTPQVGPVGDSRGNGVRCEGGAGPKCARGADGQGDARNPANRPGALSPYRTAAGCIDWSDLGTSIFDRKRPLRPKTLARIAEGIRRYVLNDPKPFVLRVNRHHAPGGGWHVWPVDESLRTQTGRQEIGLAVPVIAPQNGGVFGQRPDVPGPAITTKGHQSLITPILATTGYGEREGQRARVQQVADLLGTSVDGIKQALVTPILAGAGGSAYAAKPTRVDGPANTVKPDTRQGLVTPVLMHNTTGHPGGRVDAPAPTVTTGGQTAVVAPVMAYLNQGGKQSGTVEEPLRTVVGGGTHAMLVAALLCDYYGNADHAKRPDKPMGTVTTLDRHGLVCCLIDGTEYVIVDILFRMLRPRELAKAMGFREDYIWPKTQRDTVRLIGNAVSPPMAKALIGAALPKGRPEPEAVAA